jgi:hypothetical protein
MAKTGTAFLENKKKHALSAYYYGAGRVFPK